MGVGHGVNLVRAGDHISNTQQECNLYDFVCGEWKERRREEGQDHSGQYFFFPPFSLCLNALLQYN